MNLSFLSTLLLHESTMKVVQPGLTTGSENNRTQRVALGCLQEELDNFFNVLCAVILVQYVVCIVLCVWGSFLSAIFTVQCAVINL